MARTLRFVLLAIFSTSAVGQTQQAPQTWSALLSDSKCGMSHQTMSAAASMTERECAFHCLKALATYVLVDQNGTVLPIANQNFPGLPLRLARPVRVTGQMTDDGIVVSRIEPPLVHVHIGHVMTGWRDTPGAVGLLTVAANDARVASSPRFAGIEVRNTRRGEDACRSRAPCARPHDRAEGTCIRLRRERNQLQAGCSTWDLQRASKMRSPAVKTHAGVVSAKLSDAIVATDRAIATAQRYAPPQRRARRWR